MLFLFYTVIMFKRMTIGKRRTEQFTLDISHKGNAIDHAWRVTTPGDKPNHHARKAHKKTRIVV